NRDHERTPMQWDSSPGAGFSKVESWLPVADDYREWNVENQMQQKNSFLWLYKRLLELRRNEPALYAGDYVPLTIEGEAFAFKREHKGSPGFVVALNFSGKDAEIQFDQSMKGKVVINTLEENEQPFDGKTIRLRGNEGMVIKIS